jgi:hypothetical protein
VSDLLTDAERDRFAAYLERDVEGSRAILSQMEKVGGPDVLIRQIRTEMVAAEIVAKKLRSIESTSIDRRTT